MKLYYCPSFNNRTYIDYTKHGGMLWNEAVVGANALLEQLLLRTGLTQVAAEEVEERIAQRRENYKKNIADASCAWVRESLNVDPEGTVDKILEWRDCLVMEGWTPKQTCNASSEKLKSLSQWENNFDKMSCPGRADLWRLLYDKLTENSAMLEQSNLEVVVHMPKELVPQLIVKVLEKLPKVTYLEYEDSELKTENRSIIQVREQYEAWQQTALQQLESGTMVVCEDEDRLNNTIKGLCGEAFNTNNAGCIHPADDITNQLDTPKKIVWFDCAGSNLFTYRFSFLNLMEMKCLEDNGLALPSAEKFSNVYLQWMVSLLNKAEQVEIFAPGYQESDLLGEHPMVTELKHRGVDPKSPNVFATTTPQNIITFEPVLYLKLDPKYIAKLPQGSDSASSLEELYQRPFDFFMEKMAGLKAPEDDSDESIVIQKGKVAHYVVEQIVNQNKGDLAAMRKEISNYNQLLDNAMKKEGSLLLEPDNKNALAIFKAELKDSIVALFEIIDALELTPVECEHEFNLAMSAFNNAHGFVDMILKDKDGKYVIIDLKYSKYDSYKESLADNKSLQLTYYKHALVAEGKDVTWCGYYLFPLQKLFVQKGVLTSPIPNNVEEVTLKKNAISDSDFWKLLDDTYVARKKEISSGRIEEGEGFEKSNFTAKSDELVEYEKKLKKTAFCKYKSKEELTKRPTTHTILKNHLN